MSVRGGRGGGGRGAGRAGDFGREAYDARGQTTVGLSPADRRLLPKLVEEALSMGFDIKARRPDGRTFSNLPGPDKMAIIRAFVNARRVGHAPRRMSTPDGEGSSSGTSPVNDSKSTYRWQFMGSGSSPTFTAVEVGKTVMVHRFPDVTEDVTILKLHLLMKAVAISSPNDPLASMTAIDVAEPTKAEEMVQAAINSRFAVKKLLTSDDVVGYRISFTKPVKYKTIISKIKFIIHTMNLSTEPWLYTQPWALVKQDFLAPTWDAKTYVDVVYKVDD